MVWMLRDVKRCLWTLGCAVAALGVATAADAAPFTVQGQIVDPQGLPVPDSPVDLRHLPTPYEEGVAILTDEEPLGASLDATRTDSQGRYVLTAPGWGLYRVEVRVPGYLPVAHRLTPLLGDASLAKLTLRADEGAVIDVRDADGQAVEGARLVLRWHRSLGSGWNALGGWYPALRRRTVERDRAVVVPYVTGEHVDVAVFRPGYRPWAGRMTPEVTAFDVTLRAMDRGHTVEVREGEAMSPEALVMWQGWPVALADAEGRVELPASTGPVDLQVITRDGQQHAVSWSPGTALTLDAPQWTPGRVVQAAASSNPRDAAEEGVPEALVWDRYSLRRVEADAEGYFRWPSHGPSLDLRANKPGFAAGVPPGAWAARKNDSGAWRIVLQSESMLHGQVVDLHGRGIPGAILEGQPERSASEGRRRVTADSAGRFEVRGLTAGTQYRLRAEAEGYAPRQVEAEPGSLASPAELSITLQPGPVLIGRTVDAASGPVEGVRVELFGIRQADGSRFEKVDGEERSAAPTFSDADGRFEFRDVPPGHHTLALRAPGYALEILIAMPLDAAVGQHDLGDLTLERAVVQDLLVLDRGGLPVPGARVGGVVLYPNNGRDGFPQAFRDLLYREAETDADGLVSLGGLHPKLGVRWSIQHPQYIDQRLRRQPSGEILEVTLDAGASLGGRVVDSQGQGLEGARLTAHTRISGVARSATSQADGTFSIHALTPGQWKLSARLEGYQEGGEIPLEVGPDDSLDGLRVELRAVEPQVSQEVELHGRVLGPDGDPVPFASVSMQSDGSADPQHSSGTYAGLDGTFDLTSPGPGDVIVEAKDKQGGRVSRRLRLFQGMPAVTLILEPGQVLAGRVVDADGQGVQGARVAFRGPSPLPGRPVDEDGRFLTPLEQGGRYTIVATRQDLGRARVDVEVPEGGSLRDVELVLRPTGRIVGQLNGLQTDDLPALIVLAALRTPGQEMGSATRIGQVDFEGGLQIEGIFPGLWTVTAYLKGSARRAQQTVEMVHDGDTVTVDLDLGEAGFTLTGRVMLNGVPAQNAWINPGQVYVDTSGSFRLQGLQPGPYRLEIHGHRYRYEHSGEIYTDQDVEIAIESFSLAGLVVDAIGQPLAGVKVQCLEQREGGLGYAATTGNDGRFELSGLLRGAFRLEAKKSGYGTEVRSLEMNRHRSDLHIVLQSPER